MEEISATTPSVQIPFETWANTLSEHNGHKWSCPDIVLKFNELLLSYGFKSTVFQ